MSMLNVESIKRRLEKEGYRMTGPRLTVLEEVAARTVPFTSTELLDAIRNKAPGTGRATVFRTLDLLARMGAVQRIHEDADGGGCHAYLACAGGHHHHLICSACGTVTDFQEEHELDDLVREVEKRTRFRVEGHRLELVGLCPMCMSREDV
ncbi:MAG: transcriptional repressor [Chloroflexota bacterium]|nr:transcriptional repressor [Chloroflexota bacterium]